MRRLNRLWGDSGALANIARGLRAAAIVLLAAAAAHKVDSAFALRHLVVENSAATPVESSAGVEAPVGVEAPARAEVRRLIENLPTRSLARLDLDRVRADFERLPAVREAEVFRELPGRLRVRIYPQRAFARFGDGAVNVHGERIAAAAAALPILHGPKERVAEIAETLDKARAVLNPIGLDVNQVSLSRAGEWRIFTDRGFVVRLGADNPRARLLRFAALYPRAREIAAVRRARYFDLRYPHGMAVGE